MSAPDTALVHDEQRLAWELRAAWMNRRRVRATLTERCIVTTIVGKVSGVSVTGAWAVIDGWHVPTAEVRGVARPTIEDTAAYAQVMHDLREQSSCEFCQGQPVRNARGWVADDAPTAACPRCGVTSL